MNAAKKIVPNARFIFASTSHVYKTDNPHPGGEDDLMVNDHTAFRADWMPFGGGDSSGIGMGGIAHTIDEMTRTKLTVFKSRYL
ncbi:hypothetical protein FUA48_15980 [Flavobacterium alkalisoli]|uniref:Aldehyde dehydrogenase family protein n=1 Tax=Flavobacterium alkalisoli TaxID=2602769 RepID=A0A5B9FWU9_9FLAO|nr:hypothetical protein FUA48_15980 [Flavobacterium alkalisoli]